MLGVNFKLFDPLAKVERELMQPENVILLGRFWIQNTCNLKLFQNQKLLCSYIKIAHFETKASILISSLQYNSSFCFLDILKEDGQKYLPQVK